MAPAEYARRVFTLDVRSLALMRIAVAVTVLVDLARRLVHATEHYSDAGVLPRDVAGAVSWLADVSLLSLSGSLAWVVAVFVVAIVLALCVLVGWRTRIATPALWVVLLGIQHRNALIWDHRDALFSCSLLFGTLLPWGAAVSLDARRDGPLRDPRHSGPAVAAYIVQIACIYLFAALMKDGPEWRSDFTAVERAVSIEYWARPIAQVVIDHPGLAQVLTVGTLLLEFAVAPLLLCPWRTGALRWIAVGGIGALQLGFALFLWLDTFPMIATAMTLGLLPSSLWSSHTPLTEPPVERTRWIRAAATALAAYILALNVLSLSSDPAWPRHPAELLGIPQDWSMFAPSPSRLDGWFVVLARRSDGSSTDLLGERADGLRPASFREGIRTTRELVYMRRLLSADEVALDAFAAARCRSEPSSVAIAVHFTPVRDGVVGPREVLVDRACR
jgi:hypothetical protein